MEKSIKKVSRKAKKYQLRVITQMLKLVTNGFGLVAALAWNNVIKEFVAVYVKPYVGANSGLISLFVYAIIVTILAVSITLQLSSIKNRLEENGNKKA